MAVSRDHLNRLTRCIANLAGTVTGHGLIGSLFLTH